MSDAARLAALAFSAKPKGVSYENFALTPSQTSEVLANVPIDAQQAAFASCISLIEAYKGIKASAHSWAVVKLYYSAFYSLRALLLCSNVVPFHCDKAYFLEVSKNKVLPGGKSSHQWNWKSIDQLGLAHWSLSDDSRKAYEKLRDYREDVNYRQPFLEPEWQPCLPLAGASLEKRFKTYLEDDDFTYTYLADHLALAYPIKLVYAAGQELADRGYRVSHDKLSYLDRAWAPPHRHPLKGTST